MDYYSQKEIEYVRYLLESSYNIFQDNFSSTSRNASRLLNSIERYRRDDFETPHNIINIIQEDLFYYDNIRDFNNRILFKYHPDLGDFTEHAQELISLLSLDIKTLERGKEVIEEINEKYILQSKDIYIRLSPILFQNIFFSFIFLISNIKGPGKENIELFYYYFYLQKAFSRNRIFSEISNTIYKKEIDFDFLTSPAGNYQQYISEELKLGRAGDQFEKKGLRTREDILKNIRFSSWFSIPFRTILSIDDLKEAYNSCEHLLETADRDSFYETINELHFIKDEKDKDLIIKELVDDFTTEVIEKYKRELLKPERL